MARALGHHHSFDRVPARATRLTGTPVHHQTVGVFAGATVGQEIGEIVETRPPVLDSGLEDVGNGGEHLLDLVRSERAGRALWVDSCTVEHLVCIDVPEAGHEPLVQ
jgi:hypothetical protein